MFNWFVIGEKKNREKNLAEQPPLAERYCTKLKFVCKQLIISELFVEAARVELITILITRNLLILGTVTKAKKAPLSDPLYVYCTKTLSHWSSAETNGGPKSHRFEGPDREKHPLPSLPEATFIRGEDPNWGTMRCRTHIFRPASAESEAQTSEY